MDLHELETLKSRAYTCSQCTVSSYDSCYTCKNRRISDTEVYEIIDELIQLKYPETIQLKENKDRECIKTKGKVKSCKRNANDKLEIWLKGL